MVALNTRMKHRIQRDSEYTLGPQLLLHVSVLGRHLMPTTPQKPNIGYVIKIINIYFFFTFFIVGLGGTTQIIFPPSLLH